MSEGVTIIINQAPPIEEKKPKVSRKTKKALSASTIRRWLEHPIIGKEM